MSDDDKNKVLFAKPEGQLLNKTNQPENIRNGTVVAVSGIFIMVVSACIAIVSSFAEGSSKVGCAIFFTIGLAIFITGHKIRKSV